MGTLATAEQVADYFVWFCHETGDFVSNLEIQKYLYYAQGWYLGIYNEPLFTERLEAWVHGPVQPATYGRFKHNRWNPISDRVECPEFPERVYGHLVEVYEAYGKFSGWDLERLTHSEAPWRDARGGIQDDEPSSAEISHESMRRHFRDRLESKEQATR